MKGFLMDRAIGMLLPIIVGIIVPFAVDALKLANRWLDKAPAPVKQTMALVIAGLITATAAVLGIPLPTDLGAWDAGLINTVIAGLLGIAWKQHKQLQRHGTTTLPDAPPLAVPPRPVDPNSPFYIPDQPEP